MVGKPFSFNGKRVTTDQAFARQYLGTLYVMSWSPLGSLSWPLGADPDGRRHFRKLRVQRLATSGAPRVPGQSTDEADRTQPV
jgi:hypothetical protein